MSTTTPDAATAHLRASIDLAHEALGRGDAPFGAVVVSAGGEVIARGRNAVVTADDPTAHAETVAMLALPAGGRSALVGSTVYASGEPCPMCSAAMVWAGVGRIVFATSASAFGRVLPASPSFTLTCADVVGASDADVEVVGPALQEEGLAPFREAADRSGRNGGETSTTHGEASAPHGSAPDLEVPADVPPRGAV